MNSKEKVSGLIKESADNDDDVPGDIDNGVGVIENTVVNPTNDIDNSDESIGLTVKYLADNHGLGNGFVGDTAHAVDNIATPFTDIENALGYLFSDHGDIENALGYLLSDHDDIENGLAYLLSDHGDIAKFATNDTVADIAVLDVKHSI